MEERSKGLTFVLVAAAFWGSSFVVIKLGLAGATPVTSTLLRFAVAAVASTVILRGGRPVRLELLKDPLVVLISLMNAVGFVLQYIGLADTNSAVAALLANLGVVVVAGLSPKVLGEKVTARVALAVALTFVGGTLLATRGDLASLSTPEFRAAAAIAVGSMIWSIFVVLNKLALDRRVGTDAELSWGVLVLTAVWLLPAVFLIDGQPRISDPAVAWGAALYTGVLCSSVSYVIYMAGLRRLGATVAAVVTVAEIVVAFVLTVVVYGSVLSGVAAAGAILVVAGIVLAGLQQSRAPRDEGASLQMPETTQTR